MSMNHLIAASLIASLAGPAFSQDQSAGQGEYMVACAVCHGETAMGDGPFASLMNVEVPGLTGLSAANEGIFPYLEVFMIVDGRTGVRSHGTVMPIWGDRYSRTAREEFGFYGAEVITRGRVGVLVDYLESIQE
ncbi:cytochrome c [Yoonia sp.]|uniref:c-type cytochrome n=1 Tax=Yoonia sp. TaxID=2212373 RepID=UPI0025F1C66E|nr:cytochrome c [Yoonia sp.]